MDTWVHLEPHRRHGRRPPRHRRHQRQPHPADGPRRRWTGTTSCSSRSASRGRCCPRSAPRARSTARPRAALGGIPVAGDLGDQQAALFGQTCFAAGEAKNTYGTGYFLLLNTGTEAVPSKNGLLTTVGYKIGDQPAVYALEGSIAITGALVQWLRDNLGLIKAAPEVEELAPTVDDNGGVYFVPAFSGLFAPYWRADARGAIVGLTRYVNQGHIARAALEATAWQTREVRRRDERRLGRRRSRRSRSTAAWCSTTCSCSSRPTSWACRSSGPAVAETTALGRRLRRRPGGRLLGRAWTTCARTGPRTSGGRRRWTPSSASSEYRYWKKAVTRTFDWVEKEDRGWTRHSNMTLVIGGGRDRPRRRARRRACAASAPVLRGAGRPGAGHHRPLPRPAALGRPLRA